VTNAELRAKPNVFTVGFLLVEVIIGYEWFMSGLVKFVRGDFPSGLAAELLKKSAEMAPWYGTFIKGAVIPNGVIFGYAIEVAELLAGVALIAAPLIWLFVWSHVSDRLRLLGLLSVASAAIGGAFLAINLHLANAGSHPWLLPGDGFDEGIDLDSVLPAIQIVIATVSIVLFRRIRRAKASGTPFITSQLEQF
jgi:uncharacterized membrane protein YphA (DoxX/SURF4 family)